MNCTFKKKVNRGAPILKVPTTALSVRTQMRSRMTIVAVKSPILMTAKQVWVELYNSTVSLQEAKND